MKSNKDFLKELQSSIADEKASTDNKPDNKSNIFAKGLTMTRDIMSGEKVKTPRLMVDTTKCFMWENHNRNFELLNEENCADLISTFKETGRQEIPALVRLKESEEGTRYEIICGARRFWTSIYLGWKLFVEVRDISDEEAFRLGDIENRGRRDISDYERALEYKKALSLYYTNQAQMAKRLEVSTDWLSRYLDLADLPMEVVSSFKDITEIKVLHARKLKPYLNDAKHNENTKKAILNRAREISESNYDGAKVINQLLAVTNKKEAPTTTKKRVASENGQVVMTIEVRRDKKIVVVIDKKSNGTSLDVKNLLDKHLDDFLK